MKKIYTWIIIAILLPVATGTQAGTHTVDRVDGNNEASVEGSFLYELTNMVDGDTLLFDTALANDTIMLTSNLSGCTANGYTYTIIGNGVTISGNQSLTFGTTGSNHPAKIIMENIHFVDMTTVALGGNLHLITNCTFRASAAALADFKVRLHISGTTTIFTGCAFTTESGATRFVYLDPNNNPAKVSFVSCTFVKPAGTYTTTNRNLIYFANATTVEFANCVLLDATTATPYSIRTNNFVSKDYNVIQGSVTSTWTENPNWLQGSDIYINPIQTEVTDSVLTFADGKYKVTYAGGKGKAYRHLPENTTITDVDFPIKDLSRNIINYTIKTNSGAWQDVYLANGETETQGDTPVESVTIAGADTVEIWTEQSHDLSAGVLPNTANNNVTWYIVDADPAVATLTEPGDRTVRVSATATTRTDTVVISVVAVSVGMKSNNEPATDTVRIRLKPYLHVQSITLPNALSMNNFPVMEKPINFEVHPANANNPKLTWTISSPDIKLRINTSERIKDITSTGFTSTVPAFSLPVGFISLNKYRDYVESGLDPYEIEPPAVGTQVIFTATSDDNPSVTASCTITVTGADLHVPGGVFLLCEGNYPGGGPLNFFYPDGHWDELLYGGGRTSHFATIYNDKLYYIAKQNKDLIVLNARTMKKEHHCLEAIEGGDPRMFLGVNEHKGYLSSSNGIYVFNLDFGTEIDVTPLKRIIGTEGNAVEKGQESDPTSGLYTKQTGAMLRAGSYVFANNQTEGLFVIDSETDEVVHTMQGIYNGLTIAGDGYVWSGTSGNRLLKIDPWTLAVETLQLPDGAVPPTNTAWGAWRFDNLFAHPTENKLYWSGGETNSGKALGTNLILRYDIATNKVDTVHDLKNFDDGEWRTYVGTFGVHPTTGKIYIANFRHQLYADLNFLEIDPEANTRTEYPIMQGNLFPAMFVFPDIANPVISGSFPTTVTLNATHPRDMLALRPLVTDADNLDAAIIKTVTAVGDPTLVSALIRHDSLFITPLKDPAAAQATTVSLKFNSNGKVVTQDLSVTVEPGAIAHPVTGITLNRATAAIAVGQTLQLAATVNPADADNKAVKWTSNLPYIASVDDNGLVTAHLAPATVTITATTVEGGFKAVCDITAEPPAVNNPFALNCTDTTIAVGDSVQLSITESEQYTKLVWHSLNEAVATVSDSGMVTAVAPGTAKIMVEDPESDRFDVCMITVPMPYYIHLDHTVLIMNEGDMVTVKATISPPDSTVNWSTGDGTVADVTDKGLVIAGVPGNAIIVARLGNTQIYDACKVTVRDIPFTVEVSEVGSDRATLKFPRVSSANCYPVYLYEGVSDSPVSVDTVKATAQSPNIFNFTQLKPDFFYEVAVAVISTVNGVDETVSTTTRVQFNTKVSTSIGGIDATTAAAWYSGGVLRLRNLKGYAGHVTSVTGQALKVVGVNSNEETFAVSLSPGIYILTAQKEGDRKTFKFVVH